MPQERGRESDGEKQEEKTLAEIFARLDDPRSRRELEQFRIKFESEFGETDMLVRNQQVHQN